ncbi:MAG TPA: hypothetical protein VIB39_02190 [Candidatus Angelobacter sp.]|jgi:hypothetical protein
MSDQNNEKKLDDLLDSALAEYSAVEPRPGLEARILARVQDAAEQPRAPWWTVRWLVTGAAAAAIAVIVLSMLFLRPAQKPQQVEIRPDHPQAIQPQPHPNSERASAKTTPVRGERPQHHAKPQQELAQRDRPSVFPTPMGLSEQEKLMMAYLAQTPKEEIIAQLRAPDPKEEEEFWKELQTAAARPQR